MSSPHWINTLKNVLGHDDEPYPGTPAYYHRRRLVDSLSSLWRSHLHNLVLSDLKAGLHGRRKHFWEEMECIVVYELAHPLDLPSRRLPEVGNRLDEDLSGLDHLALHATYIFCPGFSGKNICPMPPTHLLIPKSQSAPGIGSGSGAVSVSLSPTSSVASSRVWESSSSNSSSYPPSLISDSSSSYHCPASSQPSSEIPFADVIAADDTGSLGDSGSSSSIYEEEELPSSSQMIKDNSINETNTAANSSRMFPEVLTAPELPAHLWALDALSVS